MGIQQVLKCKSFSFHLCFLLKIYFFLHLNSEQIVQLTFVGNNTNGTFNLGNISDPLQTNFSGQVITGVANLTNSSIPIYGTITNFTQTNGGPVQLETYNLTNELPQGTFFDKGGLSNLTVLPSLFSSVIT